MHSSLCLGKEWNLSSRMVSSKRSHWSCGGRRSVFCCQKTSHQSNASKHSSAGDKLREIIRDGHVSPESNFNLRNYFPPSSWDAQSLKGRVYEAYIRVINDSRRPSESQTCLRLFSPRMTYASATTNTPGIVAISTGAYQLALGEYSYKCAFAANLFLPGRAFCDGR